MTRGSDFGPALCFFGYREVREPELLVLLRSTVASAILRTFVLLAHPLTRMERCPQDGGSQQGVLALRLAIEKRGPALAASGAQLRAKRVG